jgi:hypothetical protein
MKAVRTQYINNHTQRQNLLQEQLEIKGLGKKYSAETPQKHTFEDVIEIITSSRRHCIYNSENKKNIYVQR